MKKFIIFMMATMFSLVINAQTSKLFDNTYVGVNAGLAMPLNMDNATPLNPTFGIRAGKDFTPVFGLNIEETTWFKSNLGKHRIDNKVIINVGANSTINWSNLISKKPHKLEFISVAGLGWLHTFSGYDYLSAKTALDIAWNPSSTWKIYVEPGVFWTLNRGDKVQFKKNDAQLFFNVGINYNL